MIKPEFFDTINYSICRAVNERLGGESGDFFERVGEFHLDEALKKGLIKLGDGEKPLDVLIKIAKYLESTGYMKRISVSKLSDKEAIVEMRGVSVSKSSDKLISEGNQPSHFMTNMMFAALKRLGVQATLRDMEYCVKEEYFKEYWKII